jgi:hypothetical protein
MSHSVYYYYGALAAATTTNQGKSEINQLTNHGKSITVRNIYIGFDSDITAAEGREDRGQLFVRAIEQRTNRASDRSLH